MSLHIDVLGRLHAMWGAFGLLTGSSLFTPALGPNAALDALGLAGPAGQTAVGIFVVFGGVLFLGGLAALIVGLALSRRAPAARMGALVLAVPHLVLAPFGTALGVYTFWVLLNDDARRAFGRAVPRHLVSVDRS